MGKKAAKAIVIALLCAASIQLPVHAATASDLYEVYGKEFTVDLPEDVVAKIRAYESAKKYVSMYNYVANSEFDVKAIEDEIRVTTRERDSVSNELLAGYDKSTAELFELESRYTELSNKLDRLQKSLESFDVDVTPVNIGDVPTYSEYVEALRERNDILGSTEIGDLEELQVPVQSLATCKSLDDTSATYRCVEGTGVVSLFNGTVEKVYVDDTYGLCVCIDNHNGIKTYFCNLELVDVMEGETVYQYQRIGYVYGSTITLQLQLDEEYVDITKILAEE